MFSWLKRQGSSGGLGNNVGPKVDVDIFKKYEQFLDFGVKLRCQGDYAGALDSLREALRLNPRSVSALIHSARLHDFLDDSDTAIQMFDKAINIESNNADYYFFRALTYKKRENFQRAMGDLERAIQLNPNDGENYDVLGSIYIEFKKYNEAINVFDRAIERDDCNVNVLGKKGLCLFYLGEFRRSIIFLDRSIRIYPKIEEFFYYRANSKVKLGNYKDALVDFNCALDINPNYFRALLDRGRLYVIAGDFERAKVDFSTIINNSPECVEAAAAQNEIDTVLKSENHKSGTGDWDNEIGKSSDKIIEKLLKERDMWMSRAQVALARIIEMEKLQYKEPHREDERFNLLRRFLAREFHPDNIVTDGIEKIIRTEVFKKYGLK